MDRHGITCLARAIKVHHRLLYVAMMFAKRKWGRVDATIYVCMGERGGGVGGGANQIQVLYTLRHSTGQRNACANLVGLAPVCYASAPHSTRPVKKVPDNFEFSPGGECTVSRNLKTHMESQKPSVAPRRARRGWGDCEDLTNRCCIP